MTKPIMIVANWKMNPSKLRDAIILARESTKEKSGKDINIILSAPAPSLNKDLHLRRR